MLSKEESSTIFWVFGMTRPGIEPRSPGPLANTLTTRPISGICCNTMLLLSPLRIYNWGGQWGINNIRIRKNATKMIKINIVRNDLEVLLNDRLAGISTDTAEGNTNAFKSFAYKLYKIYKKKIVTAVRKHEE